MIRIFPFLGCVLIASAGWAQPPTTTPDAAAVLRQLDDGFAQVFEKTAPSVVVIDVSKKSSLTDEENGADGLDSFFRTPRAGAPSPFQMPEPSARSEGSGFFIRADGMIVTNNHVVAGAEKITVKLKDGRQFPAKLVGADEMTDIAVLKIEASGLPVATWGDSDKVRIGQLVCAIGVPYALEYSFTIGCVSGKGRSGMTPETTPYEDYLQTSALINPGNSGGPLLDVEGRVVGMATLVNGLNRGLAFAIPAQMLKEVSQQLMETGRASHPALGIRIETLADSSLRDQIAGVEKGVVVTTIEPDTPAYKSDLRPADVITAIDGTPVATAQELRRQVLARKIGQTVTLSVWRGGKALKIAVTAGEMPAPLSARPAADRPSPALSATACGLHLGEVTRAIADKLGLKTVSGALVTGIDPESPAAIAGIQKDDVITEVDSKPAPDPATARKLLESHVGTKAVLLFIERKGQKTYAVVKTDK
ncbi:MAG: trypsin-like peptidase domain-containing protein [Verrucomicrobia bacterium]|nr:trypsin-like peptidase domain-containing protein [Verrucomicrobiota bacterium]